MWKSTGATTAGFFVFRRGRGGEWSAATPGAVNIQSAMFFGQNKEPIQAENDEDEKGK